MDDYLENHLIISLAKADYPLFFRNDIKMMKELEAEGYCKVDEAGKVVYDSWGMGVRIGEDGFFCCFSPLEKKLERKFAERWMPERIWDAVTSDTLEQRVRKWTPPDPDHQGNFEWCARDIKTYGRGVLRVPLGVLRAVRAGLRDGEHPGAVRERAAGPEAGARSCWTRSPTTRWRWPRAS